MCLEFIDSCAHSGVGGSAISVNTKWTSSFEATYVTTPVRTSGVSLSIVGNVTKSLAYVNERYLGCAYYFPSANGAANTMMGFQSGGVIVCYLSIESDNSISIRAGNTAPGGTVLWNSGSSGLYITGNVFHYYEFHCLMGGSNPITVTCDLHVDGQVWATGITGNTTFAYTALLCQAVKMNQVFIDGSSGGSFTSNVCDIYVLNTNTTDLNGNTATATTFLGDCAVNTVIADADVIIDMNNYGGSPPPTYPTIDQIPPQNDNLYVYDNVVGHVDTFNFQPLIGYPGQILGAQLLIYARKDAEGTRCIQGLVNGTSQANLYGSQDYLSDYYDYHIWPLDNLNGTPWTPSLYNAASFGVNLSA